MSMAARNITIIFEIYRVAQKERNTYTINNFKKKRDRMKQIYVHYRPIAYKILFTARWHQDHKFWWRRFDSVAVCKVYVPKFFHCLASRGKLLLLWKTKTTWIKRSIHYVTLQCNNPGEATQRNSSLSQSWLLIQKKQILKMTLAQKNCSRIKTPSSKSWIFVSFCWKKNFLRTNALTNLI